MNSTIVQIVQLEDFLYVFKLSLYLPIFETDYKQTLRGRKIKLKTKLETTKIQ